MIQRYFTDIPLTNDVPADVTAVLHHHGYPRIAKHVARVAAEARRVALLFGGDETAASTAGWLHDVGVIIPNAHRVAICHAFNVNVLPEETAVPFILHGKLSAVIAAEIWDVKDQTILSAIACHTTLKANASLLDKILFVADKIAWDQPGNPPYLADLVSALEISLDDAAACYLDYLWQQRKNLKVIHTDFVAAYEQLQSTYDEVVSRQGQLRDNPGILGESKREAPIRNQILNDLEASENRRRELENEIATLNTKVKEHQQAQQDLVDEIYDSSE